MHLVINATEMGRQRGGNESYIAGLEGGLAQLNLPIQISLLTCQWNPPAHVPPGLGQMNLGYYRRLPFFLWQQTLALRRLKADWYLANFFLPPFLPCQGAVVVHDLSFRAHPEYFPRSVAWYMRWLTGRAVQQASRGLNPPYILALGNIHPRKNLARILEAYRGLRQQRESVPALVWAGLPRWDSSALLAQARESGVILPGFMAQEDLPALYRQATMLVYPSLYEGFGLPPLEAMACGTPVVTSNTTSLPEVVGDAALTVDPTNTEEIAVAMARLLGDASLCQYLQEAGLERAKEFTWTRTAQAILASLATRINSGIGLKRQGHPRSE
ncbi:MAG: glycosyltransferase family 4 protein [Chloroflexi bacterium]|nr:glycosyltransferase family 4 protein [Chloroflexota bacterium]